MNLLFLSVSCDITVFMRGHGATLFDVIIDRLYGVCGHCV